MKNLLIVSPHFPPSSLAGVHRARHLAKHLPSHGWAPTVITVDTRYHVEPLDPELEELLAPELRIIKTRAVPAAWTAPFGLRGEIGLRAFIHLRNAIASAVKQQPPHAVLITGSPFYPMLLSRWLTRRFGVPVVLDFQDPWVSIVGSRRRRWTKGWFAHQLALQLEPRAVHAAAWITSVSARQNSDLASRYPRLDPAKMSAVPIGGDPEDFRCVRRSSGGAQHTEFVYVGTVTTRFLPLIEVLLEGLSAYRAKSGNSTRQVRLRFVGTSATTSLAASQQVMPLAKQSGVEGLVTEEPQRVPYLAALREVANADVLLLVGSDEPHYTASKIYPSMMSGRPFLSLFHEASSAHSILAAAGGGVCIAYSPRAERAAMVSQIAAAFDRLVTDAASVGCVNGDAYAAFTANAVAGQFADILARVASR